MLEERLLAGHLAREPGRTALKAAEADVVAGAVTAPQGVERTLKAIGLNSDFGEA